MSRRGSQLRVAIARTPHRDFEEHLTEVLDFFADALAEIAVAEARMRALDTADGRREARTDPMQARRNLHNDEQL